MARSNVVKRTEFIASEGMMMHVFDCSEGHEFNRPVMRGVKPFECIEHTTIQAPRKPKAVRPEFNEDCGGCSNGECCTSCYCCVVKEAPANHYQWPNLIAFLKASTPQVPIQPYLYGEAGTGKTFTSGLAAKELGLEFRAESCSIGGTEVDFFGFIDANGKYHRTAFRDVWEFGGLFLADELDKASPYVLGKLNAAFASMAGQAIEFPDGPVKRHDKTYIVGAGNTDMRGGTDKAVTSQQVDHATMTRFAFLPWGFDESFEFTLVPERHHNWVRKIHGYRKAVTETKNHSANVNVSPRAILQGATMRDGGIAVSTIEDAVVFQGVDIDIATTIKRAAKV